jgi:hypothetical protein
VRAAFSVWGVIRARCTRQRLVASAGHGCWRSARRRDAEQAAKDRRSEHDRVVLIPRPLRQPLLGGPAIRLPPLAGGQLRNPAFFWYKIESQNWPASVTPLCGSEKEVLSVQKVSILAALAAAFFVFHANAEVREADVTGGRVAGVSADSVVSFKGIPFAAPPVGPLRWRSPQPVKPWTGVKEAASFAPGCIQNAGLTPCIG